MSQQNRDTVSADVQGVDVPEVHVLRATQRAFSAFQPPAERVQQLLIRELALDGGLRLRSEQPLATLRFKYAFDGCKCALCGSV
jgi:hypothetical protein